MTLANKLTISRILLTPLFLYLLLNTSLPQHKYYAVILFILISLTDLFDGIIARKFNQVSDLGKFLDPLADKFLIIGALLALIELGLSSIPVIIITFRELAIMGLRVKKALEGKNLPASRLAKLKTVFQVITIPFLILNLPFASLLLIITIVISILSATEYFYG